MSLLDEIKKEEGLRKESGGNMPSPHISPPEPPSTLSERPGDLTEPGVGGTPGRARTILKAIVALAITTGVVPFMGYWISALLLGLPVASVTLFSGPALIETMVADTAVTIAAIPIGAGLHWEYDVDEPAPYHSPHPLVRAVQLLSGSTALVIAALVAIGPSSTVQAMRGAVGQFAAGTFSGSTAKTLLGLWLRMPSLQLLGVAAAKLALLNVLPLPIFDGGRALLEILRWQDDEGPLGQSVLDLLVAVNALVVLAVLAVWLRALIAASWHLRSDVTEQGYAVNKGS